ncbi:Leucine-rich repeat protein kinase family protein [Euphorbia peplus]|nr:Leucine-rich repeat protein kinase family protein [Euphorbia peplus]
MIPFRVVLPILLISLVFPVSTSEDENVRQSLVQFMDKLSEGGNVNQDPNWGWNITSDPCVANWTGVFCDPSFHVKRIILNDYNLTGIFDDTSLCLAESLNVISLSQNSISGSLTQGIANCKQLTHLYLGTNKLSGDIPESLYHLKKLKRLDISYNSFSGQVSRIIGLLTFFVQDNQLSGPIPDFNFSQLEFFNVSNNNFSGPIPDTKGKFKADSYLVNPGLCGDLVSNACAPSNPPPKQDSRDSSSNGVLIYSGYFFLGLILLILIAIKVMSKKKKPNEAKTDSSSKGSVETSTKPSSTSDEFKTTRNRSEYSISSVEVGGAVSQSLVALASPMGKNLRFEDLLRAPAELLGKGKHGSLYKVLRSNGEVLTVKRIKDWNISNEDFKTRMERIDQVKHPRSLPALAYYCSKQEKLLVYEFQENGSLFKLLHGSQNGQVFDWENRLSVAVIIAETLTSLHQEFHEDGIGHGNLKSTNILFNKNMEPCISEYGLNKVLENQDKAFISQTDSFKLDVYGYGVILLELLTGKLVQNSGIDLGKWVRSVVTEEWTAEVFDKALLSEGASEERMVNLLQVALKCINPNPSQRPNISEVGGMINSIKEEDERSIISDPSFPL